MSPILISSPTRITAAGTQPKIIDEFVGRVNSGTSALSVAHMRSPEGWEEPGQRPTFDEFTLVLHGSLHVDCEDGNVLIVGQGQAIHTKAGEWIRYSTPQPGGCEYIAVCLPAFSPETVNRDIWHKMKIGQYEVDLLTLEHFAMDGGGLFGIVPKKLWSRSYPHYDGENRALLLSRALLVQSDGVTLIADAGLGEKLPAKWHSIYDVQQRTGTLVEQLRLRGISSTDVTHFVYTHLHFDHSGGATARSPEGDTLPVFPNARHYVQEAHLRWARNPTDKDRASFFPENWEPVEAAGLLSVISGTTEILPGIELRVVDGHTRGMMMVIVQDPPRNQVGLVYCVDLFPTAAHLPPHYVAAFDNEPILAIQEKRDFLQEVAERQWRIAFGHDVATSSAKITSGQKGFEISEPEYI